MAGPGKRSVRSAFDMEVRMSLAESDLDGLEESVSAIQASMRRLTFAIVGAALSLTTASLLLALNLITGG